MPCAETGGIEEWRAFKLHAVIGRGDKKTQRASGEVE